MKRCLGLFVSIIILCVTVPGVFSAPVSYITERVDADFYPNGTLRDNVSSYGYIEVYVGNNVDVMQQVEMTLSSISNTNILSNTARKNVAASPSGSQRTRINVNTTESDQSIEYSITNSSVIPLITLMTEVDNVDGGNDLHANDTNVMRFRIHVNTTLPLDDTSIVFQFALNTFDVNDATSIYGLQYSQGSANLRDTDFDGMYDRLEWAIDTVPGVEYVITFYGNMTPDVNFNSNFLSLDFDSLNGLTGSHIYDMTMSGITFSDRFSRGPIRQGIEIVNRTTWAARGTMKNVASGLDYIVHGWEFYKMGDLLPLISSSVPVILTPGQETKTDLYDTGSTKLNDYFSSAFDWEVIWGGSIYMQYSDSRTDFPFIYAIDVWGDKTINLVSNTVSGTSVNASDTARHIGHSALSVRTVNITTVIPYMSQNGTRADWTVSGVTVTYVNGSGSYDLTGEADVQTQNAVGSDGFVRMGIDVENALGRGMRQNDDIVLSYNLNRPSDYYTRRYVFNTTYVLETMSGTPVTRTRQENLTVPGVGVPPIVPPGAPGGAGGITPGVEYEKYYAEIVKESSSIRFISDDYVEINVTDVVVDSGDKGIKDVKIAVYVPKGGVIEETEFFLYIYDKSEGIWYDLKKDKDFILTYNGLKTVEGKEYVEYLVEKKSEGIYKESFLLKDGDKVKVNYKTTIPHGTSYILTRVFGYNYYEDSLMFEDYYTPIRREINIINLKVTESEWVPGKVVVGEPVKWTKRFGVYNPNNVSVSELIFTNVFPDTMTANLVGYGDSNVSKGSLRLRMENTTYVNWVARVEALVTKEYLIEITTPPVLKIVEMLDVLETGEAIVVFQMSNSLKNFAQEDYSDISMFIPISNKKILNISDNLEIIGDDSGSYVMIPLIKSGETIRFYLQYQESPPVMATSLNALEYTCTDFANITVFVIPSETMLNSYLEFEVIGPEPSLKTKFADVVKIGRANKFQEVKVPISVDVFSMPSGKYFTYAKFREGFSTLLSDQKEFSVNCEDVTEISISWVIVLVICIVMVLYVVKRIHRKRTHISEIKDLRKKLEDLE
ncbi:MAG: hypothetical protein JW754_04025 [Candidatus Aenigmarchaeota archaeon]|nr:hypothetical protein [Candidatus Aenigmarchaeota archaeon]